MRVKFKADKYLFFAVTIILTGCYSFKSAYTGTLSSSFLQDGRVEYIYQSQDKKFSISVPFFNQLNERIYVSEIEYEDGFSVSFGPVGILDVSMMSSNDIYTVLVINKYLKGKQNLNSFYKTKDNRIQYLESKYDGALEEVYRSQRKVDGYDSLIQVYQQKPNDFDEFHRMASETKLTEEEMNKFMLIHTSVIVDFETFFGLFWIQLRNLDQEKAPKVIKLIKNENHEEIERFIQTLKFTENPHVIKRNLHQKRAQRGSASRGYAEIGADVLD